jgi:hypothetical protein
MNEPRFDYERDRTWWIEDQMREFSTTPNGSNWVTPGADDAPVGKVFYPCQVCGVQWTAPGAAMRCCEVIHRNGQDAYSDTLGRIGVQCHGRQLHRVMGIVRRGKRGET